MCGDGDSEWRSLDRPEPDVPARAGAALAPTPPDRARGATDRARRAAGFPRQRWATAIFRCRRRPTIGRPPVGAELDRAGSRARHGYPTRASFAESLPILVADRRDDVAEDLPRPRRRSEPIFAAMLRRGRRDLRDGLASAGDQDGGSGAPHLLEHGEASGLEHRNCYLLHPTTLLNLPWSTTMVNFQPIHGLRVGSHF